MDSITRSLLADLSASFLLFLQFGALLAVTVALWYVWKGLRVARRELKGWMVRIAEWIDEIELATHNTAEEIVEPPIRVASAWAGLKAGARSLMGRSAPAGDRKPPPL